VSDDRSPVLVLAGRPDRAAAAFARETPAFARAGWMQILMLDLHYAAVAHARLGHADHAIALARAAERAGEELGYEPLPIMSHVGADHLKAAMEALEPSAVSSARRNRGGDRRANEALWRLVMVRMVSDPRTRDYVERRTKEGGAQARDHPLPQARRRPRALPPPRWPPTDPLTIDRSFIPAHPRRDHAEAPDCPPVRRG
jgi:hypothetical protein